MMANPGVRGLKLVDRGFGHALENVPTAAQKLFFAEGLGQPGQAINTTFLYRYLRSRTFRRETHEAPNTVENWNSANSFVFLDTSGEFATNRVRPRETTAHALPALQSSQAGMNILMVQSIPKNPDIVTRLSPKGYRGLTLFIYCHINPYGRFEVDLHKRIDFERMAASMEPVHMSSQLLAKCIKQFKKLGFSPEFQAYFLSQKSKFLGNSEFAYGLVTLAAQEDDPIGSASQLLSLLLDEARMGLENDDAYGEGFLETVEMAIQENLEAGTIKQQHLMEFAGHYKLVGLPVPQSLMLNVDNMTPPSNPGELDLSENLQGIARDVLADGGSAYDLFNTIDAMLAAIPEEIQAAFTNHLASMDSAIFERCALYMLLSGSNLVQEATIAGLHERFGKSSMSAETIMLLPMMRGWFAEGPIKAGLDELIKKARRKAVPVQSDTANPPIREIIASITDGVGAQSISVLLEQETDVTVAMILIKTGYGIKDAFLVPPDNGADAEELIAHLRAETGANNISPDTLRVLLEGALADGVDNHCLPAAGFLDVIDACGFLDLRPQELSLEALLGFSDPKRKIQDASPQGLGRWINDDVTLDHLEHLTDSWFEDTEETREIVATGRTARSMETKVWNFLEGRRDLWARRFLQTGVMLRDAERMQEWKTLTASAYGLMNGRSLRKIPLMEDIMYATIEEADKLGGGG